MAKHTYNLKSEVWLYQGMAAWHFISVPKKHGEDIKEKYRNKSKGWGSIPVSVTIGKTTWKTSIFPDKHSGSYILPLKAEVRKKENIWSGDKVRYELTIV